MKTNMRNWLAAGALSIAAVLAPLSAQAAKVRINIGHVLAPDSHYQIAALRLAELAAEKSNGEIKVVVFPQAQLGGEVRMFQAARTGILDMFISGQASLTTTVKEFSIFDMPYLFDSVDQANQVLAGPAGRQFLDMLPKYNVVGLGFLSAMERSVFSSKPIARDTDFKGMKIRVMQSTGYVRSYEALGAQPTPMPYAEVYMALQQGVVDGADTSPDQFVADKFMEVAKYFNRTRVHYLPAVVGISKNTLDRLSPEHRKALLDAVAEMIPYGIDYYKKSSAHAFEEMKKAGVEIVEPDVRSMKRTSQQIDEQLLARIPNGRQLYDSIQAAKKH